MNLDKWHSEFQKSEVAKAKFKCVAPSEFVSPNVPELMRTIVPEGVKIDTPKSPSSTVLEKLWYFGFMPKLIMLSFEPDSFVSVRVVTAGAVQVHMMPPASLKSLVKVDGDKVAGSKDLMNAGTEDAKIYFGTVDASTAPVALVIPACFYVSVRPVSSSVRGFRQSSLTRDERTLQDLGLLAKSPCASKLIADGVIGLLQKTEGGTTS